MKKLTKVLLALLLALAFASCSSDAAVVEAPTTKGDYPDWFLMPPQAKDAIYGVGVASTSDLSRSRDMAASRARADIAKQISVSVETMLTDYFQEAGVGAETQSIQMIESITKEIASVDLRGAKTKEAYIGDDGKVYMLVEYSLNQFIEEQVAEVFERSEGAAFAEFKADQALARLNAEVNNNPPQSKVSEEAVE